MSADNFDPLVMRVLGKYATRSVVGMGKYGQALADHPGEVRHWLEQLQEELMDATLYIERALQEMKKRDA